MPCLLRWLLPRFEVASMASGRRDAMRKTRCQMRPRIVQYRQLATCPPTQAFSCRLCFFMPHVLSHHTRVSTHPSRPPVQSTSAWPFSVADAFSSRTLAGFPRPRWLGLDATILYPLSSILYPIPYTLYRYAPPLSAVLTRLSNTP